jgi:hypothetical protein
MVHGRKMLVNPLQKRMDALTRSGMLAMSPADLAQWWDELIDTVAGMPAPVSGIVNMRERNESRMLEAIRIISRNPHLPASNAAVESRIRLTLEPFLEGRKHRYRNLARTNFLMDLAVCRAQGLFTDLDALSALIRGFNEAAGGWAPQPRTLGDRQPVGVQLNGDPAPVYSSLLNPVLLPALARQRRLAVLPVTVTLPPRAAPTGRPRGRLKGSRNMPKQDTP